MPLFQPNFKKLEERKDVSRLVRLAGDHEPQVRIDALWALVRLGTERAVEPVLAALQDPVPAVRLAGVQALGSLVEEKAVEPLLESLQDSDPGVRAAAVTALREIGDPRAEQPLLTMLADGSKEVRHAAIFAAFAGGVPPVEPVIAPLLEAMADCEKDILEHVAGQLEEYGSRTSRDEYGALYWLIREQFHRCVEVGAPAMRILMAARQSRDAYIRARATEALEKIDIYQRRTIEDRLRDALIAKLKQDDPEVRVAAIVALGKFGASHARKELKAAARSLKGSSDPLPVDRLILSLADTDREVVITVAEALGEIGDARAVEPLTRLLDDPEEVVEKYTSRANPRLPVEVTDHHYPVREAAAAALLKISPTSEMIDRIAQVHLSRKEVRRITEEGPGRQPPPLSPSA